MKTFRYQRKFLGIKFWREVEKPHIKRNRSTAKFAKRYAHLRADFIYVCEGAGQFGFGVTPEAAWNDWANWAMV